jgi:hypothetical protein
MMTVTATTDSTLSDARILRTCNSNKLHLKSLLFQSLYSN